MQLDPSNLTLLIFPLVQQNSSKSMKGVAGYKSPRPQGQKERCRLTCGLWKSWRVIEDIDTPGEVVVVV
jgi:hypothetical protein